MSFEEINTTYWRLTAGKSYRPAAVNIPLTRHARGAPINRRRRRRRPARTGPRRRPGSRMRSRSRIATRAPSGVVSTIFPFPINECGVLDVPLVGVGPSMNVSARRPHPEVLIPPGQSQSPNSCRREQGPAGALTWTVNSRSRSSRRWPLPRARACRPHCDRGGHLKKWVRACGSRRPSTSMSVFSL